MDRFVVVFENAPLDPPGWFEDVCRTAGLTLVDNEAITTAMSKSEESRRALLSAESGFGSEPKVLAPHYRAALDKVAAGESRLALHGSAWLQYVSPVTGCILDFSGLEAERAKGRPNMSRKQVDARVEEIKKVVRDRAKEHLAADRILELAPNLDEQAKRVHVAKFIEGLGGR
ncbi:MAG: hypothetical protein ACOX6T_13285 [Myxococcales bacterium]|jgi:hypothetical protein